MANIDVSALYNVMKLTFKTQGSGSTRFDTCFIRAMNRAADRINRQADLATRISHINTIEDDFALDEAYEDVVNDIVVLELMKIGQRPAKGMEDATRIYTDDLDNRIDDIRQDILNQAVAADDDDETSYVGLGALNA